jgi:hypothetical protein
VRDKFFEGGKTALVFNERNGSQGEKATLKRQVEDLQKLIGGMPSRSVFKTAVREQRPRWTDVEAARVAEGLTVKQAMKLLGIGIVAAQLLPPGARDEGLASPRSSNRISQAQRRIARSSDQTCRSGRSSSAHLRHGIGEDIHGCGGEQPDELLSGAQERGVDPA